MRGATVSCSRSQSRGRRLPGLIGARLTHFPAWDFLGVSDALRRNGRLNLASCVKVDLRGLHLAVVERIGSRDEPISPHHAPPVKSVPAITLLLGSCTITTTRPRARVTAL